MPPLNKYIIFWSSIFLGNIIIYFKFLSYIKFTTLIINFSTAIANNIL